jgi:hypothetical protein
MDFTAKGFPSGNMIFFRKAEENKGLRCHWRGKAK